MSVIALLVACYVAPVPAPVATPFVAPACAYCVGHRILEYDTSPGGPVVAAAAGRVTFVGVVVGTRYVTIQGNDGLRATYGMLASIAVPAGSTVSAGDVIATSTDHFSFGLRIGDLYVDPAPFIGTVNRRARLVPANGAPGRPPRTRPPTCAAVPPTIGHAANSAGARDGSRR